MGITTLKMAGNVAKRASDAAAHHIGRHLLDAVERALRAPQGRMALVLHLSQMAPPAPRAHHRRIARAVMDDAAQRHAGQVFALHNDDLVLLFRSDDAGIAVTDTLARLFLIDVPDPSRLTTLWSLARDADAVKHYVQARLLDTMPDPDLSEPIGSTHAIDAIDQVIQHSRISDLMQRQTAVLLMPGSQLGLKPLFREITFSVAVLEARIALIGQANADPFLFRHLASRLDGRMLDVLRQDLQVNGPLTAGGRSGPMLHLNLTLAGILSDRFARFAATCRALGAQIGVEISLVEACADPEAFIVARTRLRLAGLTLVLDGVSHHALMLTMPMVLEPDLVKLDWSQHLPEAGPAVEQAVMALGRDRVVLHRAETEQALSWGLAHGIRRFQGRHVDAMLAAGRIGGCAHSGGCTLRQCIERASATGPGGRAGCNNPPLLDAAFPLNSSSTASA
jgi:hypothetical protein